MEFTDLVPNTTLTVADALVLAANAVQADVFQTFRANQVQRDKIQTDLLNQILEAIGAFGAAGFGDGPFGG